MFETIKTTEKKSRIASVKVEGKERSSIILNSSDFIFSQTSIASSVFVEPGTYLIHPLTNNRVNRNGDTWSNESLRANYKSFIGAYNYLNHVQEPDKAVGFIPDAVLRKLIISPKIGVFIYYVDLLVATHRDFKVADDIQKGVVEWLSMGCESESSICSKCGFYSDTEDDLCDCLAYDKGKTFVDEKGNTRIIAELLGNAKKGSTEFIEASFLTSEPPAFHGAVKRNLLNIPKGTSVQLLMDEQSIRKDAVTRFLT